MKKYCTIIDFLHLITFYDHMKIFWYIFRRKKERKKGRKKETWTLSNTWMFIFVPSKRAPLCKSLVTVFLVTHIVAILFIWGWCSFILLIKSVQVNWQGELWSILHLSSQWCELWPVNHGRCIVAWCKAPVFSRQRWHWGWWPLVGQVKRLIGIRFVVVWFLCYCYCWLLLPRF